MEVHLYFHLLFIEEVVNSDSHISEEEYSGALILVPSFSLQQNSSSIWTPGYGEAPGRGERGRRSLLSYLLCIKKAIHRLFVSKYDGKHGGTVWYMLPFTWLYEVTWFDIIKSKCKIIFKKILFAVKLQCFQYNVNIWIHCWSILVYFLCEP